MGNFTCAMGGLCTCDINPA
uniref:Uncharacterized protein n=1 Tax=Anguilla anguilla TaxID=7936 RepID=A0A0E9VKR8_ANGAN